jgi:hypothetical protein
MFEVAPPHLPQFVFTFPMLKRITADPMPASRHWIGTPLKHNSHEDNFKINSYSLVIRRCSYFFTMLSVTLEGYCRE